MLKDSTWDFKLKSKGQYRKGRRSSTRKEGDQASPLVTEAKNSAKLKEKETGVVRILNR